jgi:hypothetical protein
VSCCYYSPLKLDERATEKIGGHTGLTVWRKFQAWMSVNQDSRGGHMPEYSRDDVLIYVESKVWGTVVRVTQSLNNE